MSMNRTAAEYQIMPCHAHFEVYKQGIFICSADTLTEAEQDIKLIEQNKEQKGKVRTA